MSSSRSIAAARNRRSGDPTPKIVSQQPSRPVTSISSQSAFISQPYPGNNIRVSGKKQNQQANFTQQKTPNGLPFSKLSVSDAIGLVTLRLGRVEQFMIYLQEQEGENGQKMGTLPENTKLMDNSVLNNIISRLDSLEKKESSQEKNDVIVKLQNESDNIKNILETLSNKLMLHEKNTNENFIDYENALFEIENKDSSEEINDEIAKLLSESDNIKNILEPLTNKFELHEKNINEKFITYENALIEIENKNSSQEKNDLIIKLQKESDNVKNILETLLNKLMLHEKNTNEKFMRYENKDSSEEKSDVISEKDSDNIKNILETLLNKIMLHEKNTNEKFMRYENESDSIKNILETLSNKLDLFEKSINEKFINYENSIVEIENKYLSQEEKYQESQVLEEINQDYQDYQESEVLE